MSDLEIIALINAEIAGYAKEYKQRQKEIQALLVLKTEIEIRIQASLNHQAQRAMAQQQ